MIERERKRGEKAEEEKEEHVYACGCENPRIPLRAIFAKHSRREAPRMILGFSIGNYIRSTLISTPWILILAGMAPITSASGAQHVSALFMLEDS